MLDKNIFVFLKNLKNNNSKEWFDENRNTYKELRKNFMDFVSLLIFELSIIDPSVQHIEAKDSVFRINRDIRFSNDKSPYKINMGAFITPGGKKAGLPGYYLHLEPGSCFVAGGVYMPPPNELKLIRSAIFENPVEYKKITEAKSFKNLFGEVDGVKLKTAPKGFPKEDSNIELIKLKSYTVSHAIDEKILSQKNALAELMKIYSGMKDFNMFLKKGLEE
ncbi:MAG: DUF2461 domain-containing protein [Bacteroidales bacterium]|nr:DUF2461 domain-containing protein [Bacteroidales bacterium]MCF8389614.1 DUF2461 domain-containing protein [Bacteroidales bacterium]